MNIQNTAEKKIEVLLVTPFFNVNLLNKKYFYLTEEFLINGAVVIPETEDGLLMLLKHYRPAIGQYSIEFPRGGYKKGESLRGTAKREMTEETGYEADEYVHLGNIHSNTSVIQSSMAIFHAKGIKKITDTTDGEAESVLFVDKATLKAMVREGKITDSHTLSGIAMLG